MYCFQCGAELSEGAKFCSGCGRTLDAAQPVVAGKTPRDMATHVQILAWLFIGSAVLYGMLGLALLIAPTILQQLPISLPPDVPFDVVQFVSSIAGLIGTAILLVAAGSAAAGIGLMQYQSWGRILALIMSAVMLIKIPFGTALGIYAFWVLLSQRGREYYERKSAVAEGRA
jgi:hypothetical protein